MLRSLFSGVSGLTTHQIRMDVIGNNIANVNTTAFKAQSVNFADLMYQTKQAASGPSENIGGVNPKQVGLGVKTASFKSSIEQQGSAQNTNNPFDLMITGESFFVVGNSNGKFYTRDGAFNVDVAGNLVMQSNGYKVLGWNAVTDNETGEVRVDTNVPIDGLRLMNAENLTYPPIATTEAMFEGNIDSYDDSIKNANGKVVMLDFYDSRGYSYTTKFNIKETANSNEFSLKLSAITDSKNIDISDEAFENIQLGTDKEVILKFNPENGKLISDSNIEMIFNGGAGAESFENLKIDFTNITNVNTQGTSTVRAKKGNDQGFNTGARVGEMTGVTISNNGLIHATYDNGQTKLLGQIATANFANPSGLSHEGDNLYSQTLNSGDPTIQDVTVTGGYMSTGVLEMSNVDLSKEFTDMIITQRGFQANSRTITVSDTLLEELISLKR